MLDRHIRRAGIRLIEAALSEKSAQIVTPSLAALKAQKTRQLKEPTDTATAVVPKVLTTPT